jgi:hypothetical protein
MLTALTIIVSCQHGHRGQPVRRGAALTDTGSGNRLTTRSVRTKAWTASRARDVLAINTRPDLLELGQNACQIKRKIQQLCKFLRARKKTVVQGKDIVGWSVMTPQEIWLTEVCAEVQATSKNPVKFPAL